MAENSNIQWTQHTFNPWRGCQKRPDNRACDNCYAEALSKRNPATLGIWGSEERGAIRVVAAESMWKEPVKWNRAAQEMHNNTVGIGMHPSHYHRPRVFCASIADVFEDWHTYAIEWDENHVFPVETLRKAAELGLAGRYLRSPRVGPHLCR